MPDGALSTPPPAPSSLQLLCLARALVRNSNVVRAGRVERPIGRGSLDALLGSLLPWRRSPAAVTSSGCPSFSPPPQVFVDEATSNVDVDTDAIVQSTIRSQFAHCTVRRGWEAVCSSLLQGGAVWCLLLYVGCAGMGVQLPRPESCFPVTVRWAERYPTHGRKAV
jgi:hypothetical protein